MKATEVLVIIGAGAIGQAIARRQGPGRTILLADVAPDRLDAAASALSDVGHTVTTTIVDVSLRASVCALADAAAGAGSVVQVVHTAGVSPVQATAAEVVAVDLYGAALVLDELGAVITPGGSGVVISSMAGHMGPPLPPAVSHALAHTPTEELPALPLLASLTSSASAYALAKRANQVRVQAAAVAWGQRGARINSISPGIIMTPLAQDEFAGPSGPLYRTMLEASSAQRVGTPEEVAAVAAFLLGPEAAYVTGSDLLMDGGIIAALRAGRWALPQ